MVQDIFIDTNIACKFARPSSESVKFLEWLSEKGYLVVSKKLLVEYNKTCNIQLFGTVINKLMIDNRIVEISSNQIKEFKKKHITKRVKNRLQSNIEDWNHIPVVLLSDRKIAITGDGKFSHDLKVISGYTPIVASSFEEIDYVNM